MRAHSGSVFRVIMLGGLVLALGSAPRAFAGGSSSSKSKTATPAPKPLPTATVLAEQQPDAHALRLDKRTVYFLTDHAVVSVPKAGGAVKKIAIANAPLDLSVQKDALYWTEPDEGTIRSASLDGAAVAVLLKDRTLPRLITSDPSALYWVEEGGPRPVVFAAPRKSGSTPNELVHLFSSFIDLQQSGAHLYWTDNNGGVRQVSKFGGAPEKIYEDRLAPSGHLALDDRYLFWTHPSAKTLTRKPRAGGRAVVIADGISDAGAIAVGDSEVFWVTRDEASSNWRVMTVPKKGGRATAVAESPFQIRELAVDEQTLYFVDDGPDGKLRRVMSVKR